MPGAISTSNPSLKMSGTTSRNLSDATMQCLPSHNDSLFESFYDRWGDVLKGRSNADSLDVWLNEIDVLQRWLFEHLEWLDAQLIKDKSFYAQLTATRDMDLRANAGR